MCYTIALYKSTFTYLLTYFQGLGISSDYCKLRVLRFPAPGYLQKRVPEGNSRLQCLEVTEISSQSVVLSPSNHEQLRLKNAIIICPIAIGRVSYLIYISMRHYVLTTSGDIVVCFYTAVCLNC